MKLVRTRMNSTEQTNMANFFGVEMSKFSFSSILTLTVTAYGSNVFKLMVWYKFVLTFLLVGQSEKSFLLHALRFRDLNG